MQTTYTNTEDQAFAIACDIADEFDQAIRRGVASAKEEHIDPDAIVRCFLGLYQGQYDFEAAVANVVESDGEDDEFDEDDEYDDGNEAVTEDVSGDESVGG